MTFQKQVGPNGTVITIVFLKSRVATMSGLVGSGRWFSAPAWANMWSEGCIFENPESRKWHQQITFYTSSALGPSKNALKQNLDGFAGRDGSSPLKLPPPRYKIQDM